MTKIYLVFTLVFISNLTIAQIKKGSTLLGGQLNYFHEKNKIDDYLEKTESGAIGLSVGRAYKENAIVGFSISFFPIKMSNTINFSDTINSTFKQLGVGVYFREYKKIAKDFYFFGQAEGSFLTANQTQEFTIAAGNIKSTRNQISITVTPGISYRIFRKLYTEISIPNIMGIQYSVTRSNSQVPQLKSYRSNQFGVYSNLNSNTALGFLGVGFRLIL
jgi:hypothetical protein